MQAEAIPIIATPVMNHRTLSIKNKDITSTNCNDDVLFVTGHYCSLQEAGQIVPSRQAPG